MFIHEAVKKAVETGGYITGGLKSNIFIEPTDTGDCCIVHADKNHSCRKWNPYARDLMSEEWEVVTKEEFLVLSERNAVADNHIQHLDLSNDEKFERLDCHLFMARIFLKSISRLTPYIILLNAMQLIVLLLLLLKLL